MRQARAATNKVRIEEVARLAGVSPITVSRALNTPDKVNEKTRAAVFAAVEQTGYIPNRLAGSLASNRNRTIGVIIPTITNSIFADKVQGLSDTLTPAGYQILLGQSGYSIDREADLVAAFLAQSPSGLVVTGSAHSQRTQTMLKRSGVAVVETWTRNETPLDMQVGFSNEDAAFEMVRHLHSAGYRRIALVVASYADNDRAQGRLRGYRRAVNDLGIADAAIELQAEFSFSEGARALNELMAKRRKIDAIFFANDILAVGAILECQRRGIRVPQDVGIAGFDDLEIATVSVPSLTTVSIPRYDIGVTTAQLLLRRLDGETNLPGVDLGFRIVPRESTRRVG
jgi:DNA-binding LacI/PurR family transcriptional regulator